MDKREFLKKLEKALKKLVPEERARYISYYDEIIMDLVDGGMTEQEACAKQGDMSGIVADIMSQIEPEKVEKQKPLDVILLVIALLIGVACIVVLIALPDVITFSMMNEDGPTSVFVAGKVVEPIWLYIITAVVLITSTIIFVLRKKSKFALATGVIFLVCVITFVLVRIDDNRKNAESSTTETVDVYASSEVEEKTIEIIQLLSHNDFKTLRDEYAIEELKELLNDEYMMEAKNMINNDWGELCDIGTVYSAEVAQDNVLYTVVQVNATYDNVSIAFTITFDDELKLAGIYFR
ncbi:MAG: DUF3887 domain-containing protein [Lachnospiraceae bacterium]|nr:DUF3887 domain-containing protein [Lachnospiraceae bacterium]